MRDSHVLGNDDTEVASRGGVGSTPGRAAEPGSYRSRDDRKFVVCFVDDDPEEVRRFRESFGRRFRVVAGCTLDEARQELGGEVVDLYVIDLYSSDRVLTAEERDRLHRARAVYLEAERKFRGLLAELGQSPRGGFALAREICRTTKRPVIFFTRKGTLEDAVVAYEELGVSVVKKPDPDYIITPGGLERAYDGVMAKLEGLVTARFEQAIRNSTWWARNRSVVGAFVLGVLSSLMADCLM